MLIYSILFYSFSTLAILSSTLVVLSTNPVFSALFLVLSFCNVSSLLFFLQLDFLPITFLVVYVGAIAVLFLFVLMMLNIKLTEFKQEKLNYIPLVIIFSFVFASELFFLISSEFNSLNSSSIQQSQFLIDLAPVTTNFLSFFSSSTNMKAVGQLLFVDYCYHFIIAGFILLLAMVAAITSTLNKRFIAKSQAIYAQVLRSFDKAVVNY